MKKKLCLLLSLALMVGLLLPVSALAVNGDFAPHPQTPYASQFVTACEGQQWFLNEVERLLNLEQKTIDTITDASDFDRITSIGLANKGITGNIPSAIGELHKLRGLYLSGNKLSGTIPSKLFTLAELSNIDLSGNQYSGNIPSGFGTMPALNVLQLKENAFSGTIPDTILANTTLTFLDVSSNQLTGKVPDGLGQMTSLVYLEISDNPWSIGAMPDLSALTSLKSLSAWGCNFTGAISDGIYGLANLQVLDLQGNAFTGPISPNIANLTELQLLSLGSNQFSGTVPAEIGNLPKLSTLDISNNKLRGKLPASVAAYNTVYAQNNYMTGTVLQGLTHNENNFCDGATTAQYQLTAASPVVISKTKTTNLCSYLKNKLLTTGDTNGKPILSTDCYVVSVSNDSNSKITLTTDATGIYVQANDDIKVTESITVIIQIKDNDGSDYSKVSIVLTTESTGGGGTGGGGTVTPPAPTEGTLHRLYVNGFPDGTFGPTKTITREEVAAMLTRVLEYDLSSPAIAPFPDVAVDRWSAANIAAAKKHGIVQGYDNGNFGPTNPMTRAELATVLVRIAQAQGRPFTGDVIAFTDVDASAWYADYVAQAARYGLITGYTDGTFKPTNTVTRAEAVTMINRMLNRDPETAAELKTAVCPFSDVSESYWAYLQVMEAAITHEH